MKIIALKGASNCGKTQTLNIVYSLLLEAGCVQSPDKFEDLYNGDFIDVLTFKGKTIGIVTQGDYAIGDCSVKNHLKNLEEFECDIAICACTVGYHKKKIEEAIEDYPESIFILHEESEKDSLQRIENTQKAIEIKKITLEIISNYGR